MGLLDSVLGAALGGNQHNSGGLGPLGNILGSALGGQSQGGGLGDVLGGLLGGGQQQQLPGGINIGALLPVVIGMLANRNQGADASGLNGIDGLGGLIGKFQNAGLGDAVSSWVGNGANQPVNGAQVSDALGGDLMGQIAAHLGANQQDTAGALAQVLPGLIDQLTPNGQAPQGGLGNAGDIASVLGGLLRRG